MRSTFAVLLAVVLSLAVAAPVASALGSGVSVQDDQKPKPPEERWNRTYDSPGGEIFSSIIPTSDNGYLMTGWTERDGNHDGWVIEVDADGRERWSATLGGNGTDRLYGAVRTSDGGYIVAGRTDDGDQTRGWLVKVDDGKVEWERTVASRPGAFWAIERTESQILVGGWTWQDGTAGWLVSIDEQGTVQWEKTYHSGEGDSKTYVKSIATGENGTLLAGKSENESGMNGWAAQVTEDGDETWNRTYDRSARDDVWASAATDSGYVLAGESGSEERTGRDAWVLALDTEGAVQWETTTGEDGHDWFDSATATEDGLLFTGGTTNGDIGGADGLVVMTDSDGNEQWQTLVGTPLWDKPWPAIEAHGEGYVLAGQTAGLGTDGTGGWLLRLSTPDETVNTTTSEITDESTSTARESETNDEESASLWRPELAFIVGLAALALGLLVARR